MDRALIPGMMVLYMKDSGKIIRFMERDSINGLMVESMTGTG